MLEGRHLSVAFDGRPVLDDVSLAVASGERVQLAAPSGTGKTTFLERLIPKLKARGLKIAIVKHDGHRFEIDHEGKDSDRFTKAGADVTGLISSEKAVLIENRQTDPEEFLKP